MVMKFTTVIAIVAILLAGVAFSEYKKGASDNKPWWAPVYPVKLVLTSSLGPSSDDSSLLKGKHILVIVADGYCPYCEKFGQDVTSEYKGMIPITKRTATQLNDLKIKTPTWSTPIIIFLQDGTKVLGYQGYMAPKEFYKALDGFKL